MKKTETMMTKNKKYKIAMVCVIVLGLIFTSAYTSYGQPDIPFPNIGINIDDAENPEEVATSMQILLLLTILSLAPAILIMMTSFTRIVVVLSFLRNAIATQQTPPNQIIVGLALFLTFFTMAPVISSVNENAVQPYLAEEISQAEALDNGMDPIREFMFRQTRDKELALFLDISGSDVPTEIDEVTNSVLIPAFIISELKTAFIMGFILFIPFIVIDMVVASTLMSMGMMMLPPAMISLPFKLLLFIMVDGWNIIISSIITSFN